MRHPKPIPYTIEKAVQDCNHILSVHRMLHPEDPEEVPLSVLEKAFKHLTIKKRNLSPLEAEQFAEQAILKAFGTLG